MDSRFYFYDTENESVLYINSEVEKEFNIGDEIYLESDVANLGDKIFRIKLENYFTITNKLYYINCKYSEQRLEFRYFVKSGSIFEAKIENIKSLG